MDQIKVIEAFTTLLMECIEEAVQLIDRDPEDARRVLRAVNRDIATLTNLWIKLMLSER